jgi:hypothetical protein
MFDVSESANGRNKSKTRTFAAPKKGWIKNQNLVSGIKDGAEVLDNWFPTAQGARLRNGRDKHATIGGPVKSMFQRKSGNEDHMFAASATDIYDITTPADKDVAPTADVSSLTSGDWSTAQFANAADDYLVLANGADSVRNFDGTTWTTPSITGVTSADLNQVFVFKERLFFMENNSLSFWYLAVNAIAGAATEFPLKGVFHLGGDLLFGTSWSLDTGSGLDDLAIFVTTEGEVAVYSGTDPSSSTTWALVGVYRIGKPLNKNAFFKAGGDVAIVTEDGIISISEALKKDRAALQADAITFPIEDAWITAIANRDRTFPFSVTLWHSQTMLIVGTPSISGNIDVAFVANARTGAWCRFTGWDVQASVVNDDKFYFGTSDNFIFRGGVTGKDYDVGYSAIWIPRFFEGNANEKFAVHARFRGRASESYEISLGASANYAETAIPVPTASAEESDNVWGTGLWGTMTWGGTENVSHVSDWGAVAAQGTALAPGIRLESNRTTANTLEAIALDLMYEEGEIL